MEAIKSRPLTKEFAQNFDRIFRKRESNKGGRWVYDVEKKTLVPAHEYLGANALYAPILMDRFYENTKATDGRDIGSRRKHRAYMKEKGLTTIDDYTQTWKKQAKERGEFLSGTSTHDTKDRREDVARVWHERMN
jgi:hypothetical protein